MNLSSIIISCYTLLLLGQLASAQNPDTWVKIWSDEFDYTGLPDPTKWTYEEGFIRNEEDQYYTKNRLTNARVDRGHLIIEAHRERFPNANYKRNASSWINSRSSAQYTSASLITLGRQHFRYGKMEVRAKLPTGEGVWPAIWTLGVNRTLVGWPTCGEIDIMEFVGNKPGQTHANLHFGRDGEHQSNGKSYAIENLHQKFHVYSIIWSENSIRYFVNDHEFHRTDTRLADLNAFQKPHYLILNLALGGSWGGAIDPSHFPKQFIVDYVRVYRLGE